MNHQEITQEIRETAKKLLSEGKVDVVIGYTKGSVPMRDYPYFAYTPEEAENLYWSGFCNSNLANFTIRRPGKMAVVAQGCVSRNLVGLIKENQLKREDLVVIGVASPGMLDRNKVLSRFPGKVITEVIEDGDDVVVKGQGWEETIPRKQLMKGNCYTCVQRNPVIVDEMIGSESEPTHGGDIDKVPLPWESLEPEERWAQFKEEILDRCIRCYACRDACPLCYCHVCFVDETQPQWCGKTQDEADVATFHLLRAFHCAGRCTDCGACEAACPQGIPMRRLTSKLEKDIREMYGYQPGMDVEEAPPLTVYRPDDPENFLITK